MRNPRLSVSLSVPLMGTEESRGSTVREFHAPSGLRAFGSLGGALLSRLGGWA